MGPAKRQHITTKRRRARGGAVSITAIAALAVIAPAHAADGKIKDEPAAGTSVQPSSCCVAPSVPARSVAFKSVQPPVPATRTEKYASDDVPPGMVWIPGGEFDIGSVDPLARPDERPIHRVRVRGFWIDATEVTNAQFQSFVDATGYLTVAERPDDWEELQKHLPPGTPEPSDDAFLPGSLVFTPPDHPVPLHDATRWWSWMPGASWRHPEGPGSDIAGRDDHPVVHIALEDALAYCAWAGKRLPTEAEWERAARGGLESNVNVWGNESVDPTRCNIWTGRFPDLNTAEDGFRATAPVRSYPPNAFGLYDMAGNVWEWCSDLYRADTYAARASETGTDGVAVNPGGPARSFDARNPYEPEMHVMRGGSFLCNDTYCASYRPSARMASSPDTGMSHVGFRCVKSVVDPLPSSKAVARKGTKD